MNTFLQYSATRKLQQLAERPIDLSEEGALSTDRMGEMVASACGLQLFFATERVDNPTLQALFDLAQEAKAHEKMQQMQCGEVINAIEGYACENRSVLHTAMRDLFDAPQQSQAAAEAAREARAEVTKLQKFLEKLESDTYTDIVQIGIGGSELGPKAIYLALEAYARHGRRAHFISNVDPDEVAVVLQGLDLKKTLVVVVSKSGTTLETLTNEELARSAFRDKGLLPQNHFLAVTGKGSPMDDPGRYLASFYMWDYVGGRYSATSMVGGVALGFTLGVENYLEFLRGAHAMDQIALIRDPAKNLPLLSALLGIWNHNFLNLPTTAIIPYSQALSRFPAHLQQCDMESNGKRVDKWGRAVNFWTGPIIWGEPGTNGQHSFYQLIHQGTIPVPVEFIGFASSQRQRDQEILGTTSQEKLLANLFAQSIGLATGQKSDNPNRHFPGNRPNRILFAERCDPYTMGSILAYYEHKVAFQGFIWGINSFDQEGVQLGKVLANRIIEQFAKRRLGEEYSSEFPLGAFFLERLSPTAVKT